MIRTRIRKLSNPRRVKVHRRSNAKRTKRKMSPKQIRIFGTKRQKAALKAKYRRNPGFSGDSKKGSASFRAKLKKLGKRGKSAQSKYLKSKRPPSTWNPRHVQVHRAPVKRRTKRRSNPALIVTLGAMNPRRKHNKRRKPVAKAKNTTRRRRRTTVNRRRTRRTNPMHVSVRRRRRTTNTHRRHRRSNPKVVVRYRNRRPRRHNAHHRRRNPSLFGTSLTSKEGLMILAGGLAGVAGSKFIPTLLPSSLTGSIASSNVGQTVLTGVSAVALGWIAGKWDRGFGNGVLFGGLMQTASVALNAFLPSVYQQLGISLGDLLPGQFPVPQNPIRAGMAPPTPPALPAGSGSQARMTMNGLSRAYGVAY